MPGRRPRLLAAVSVAFAITAPAAAQQTIAATSTISGVVVNGVSHAPVAQAVVSARMPGGTMHRTSSDATGRFTLAGLPPGSYRVSASAAGMFPGEFGQAAYGGSSEPVLAEAFEIRSDLTVPIWPAAAIRGRALDTGGTSVSARVWLLKRDESWDEAWTAAQADPIMTGAGGQFAFDGLEPGRYAVLAWPLTGASTVSFAPTFAPSATRGADLAIVDVASGAVREDADITIRLRDIIAIGGHLIGSPDQVAGVTVRACPTDPTIRSLGACVGEARTTADGAFRITGVAAGNYVLEAQRPRADRMGILSWGRRAVSLGTSTADADIQMNAPFNLSGVATAGNRTENVAGALVGARAVDPLLVPIDGRAASDPFQATVGPDGRFVIESLPPGEFVYVDGTGSTWMMLSAITGGRDAADEPISLDEGVQAPAAVVTLTRAGAAVSATVRSEAGQVEADTPVWLFSVEPHFWLPKSRRVQAGRTGADGSFTFESVAAGDYYVAARPDPAPRLTRAALEAAVAQGRKIQVAAGAHVQVDLTLVAR